VWWRLSADPSFRAVLFDLSGTTLDEGYIRYGFAAVAAEMASRWNIDPDAAGAAFMPEWADDETGERLLRADPTEPR
jgi:hypothetical protein